MTVRLETDAIVLSGRCGVEEVEDLVLQMQNRPELPVDVRAATTIHTALWQALLVFRPKINGASASSAAPEILRRGVGLNLADASEL